VYAGIVVPRFAWEQTPWIFFLDPIIKSAANILVSSHLKRVKQCAGDACGWLFMDKSRNNSRLWCSMKDCGNRAKAH